MLERYGFIMHPKLKQEMCTMISSVDENVNIVDDQGFPNVVVDITFAYHNYRVVYNFIEKVLVTVFPQRRNYV
jgi:hypothetical protein